MIDSSLLMQAYNIAQQSPDNSNQNGAILVNDNQVIGAAYNDFPQGIKFTSERSSTRPEKYRYFEHAERNAILMAARHGKRVKGATMYCPWASCCPCARAIIQSGVKRLVVHWSRMVMTPDRWIAEVDQAWEMMKEAGIEIVSILEPIYAASILVNGISWTPTQDPIQAGNFSLVADTEMS